MNKSREFIHSHGLSHRIQVHVNSVPPVPLEYGVFDVVLTNRSLINLTSVKDQKEVIQGVEAILRPGGMYLMIECLNEGAASTNFLRKRLELDPIDPPWHNLF